jgi:Tol biopolymer transport system component/DNA-binding winged helix-turn-helix (wHTH) protein
MPRCAFGPFTLDSERRILAENGNSVPISGKAFDVLLLLVDNRGRLVDKDELLSRVWAGSVVEESSLAHSIFALRKALGDHRKEPIYIATIAGRGYQFVAPVADHVNQTQSPEIAESPSGIWSRTPKKWLLSTAAVVAVLAAVAVWYVETAGHKVAPEPRISHFTSYPGSETMPAFSPDGKQIAYVRGQLEAASWLKGQTGQANIYTKLIGAQTELRLTNHPGTDEFPAWSPDGQFVAFYRDDPGFSGIYIVSALGGHERRVTAEEGKLQGIAWFPDGQRLLVSRLFEGSKRSPLIEVSEDTGKRRPFTSPPPGVEGDAWPAFSNDQKTLAFIRSTGSDNLACFVSLSSTGRPWCRPLGLKWPEGLAWAGRGNGIIVSGIRDSGWRLWRYESEHEGPVALTSGELGAVLPAISPQEDRLAYVLSRRNTNVWELDVSASHPVNTAEAKAVDPSNRFEIDPAIAPDGRKVAFMSDRGGSQEIWVTDQEGHSSVELTHFGGPMTGAPSWSPDGSQIAFDSNCQIYVINADGGTPRQLTLSGENCAPSWNRDGKFIYFGSGRSGDFQIWRTSALSGETPSEPAVQITQGGGFRGFESADGKYLYYAKGRGKRGLWRRSLPPTPNSTEEPVLSSLQEWGWWALSARVIYFLELSPSVDPRVHLKALNLSDGRITDIAPLPNPVVSETPAIAASQDGKRVLYLQEGSTDADIMLLDNFR